MTGKNIHYSLFLLIALALTVILAACSAPRSPGDENRKVYPATSLDGAYDWDYLAADMAERVKKALWDRPDLLPRSIYISQLDSRPFSLAFRNLLKSELVSRGLLVAEVKDPDSVTLDYNIQDVKLDGAHEVLVNSYLAHANRYVVHTTVIGRISDAEWDMYASGGAAGDAFAGSTRRVHITNR